MLQLSLWTQNLISYINCAMMHMIHGTSICRVVNEGNFLSIFNWYSRKTEWPIATGYPAFYYIFVYLGVWFNSKSLCPNRSYVMNDSKNYCKHTVNVCFSIRFSITQFSTPWANLWCYFPANIDLFACHLFYSTTIQ